VARRQSLLITGLGAAFLALLVLLTIERDALLGTDVVFYGILACMLLALMATRSKRPTPPLLTTGPRYALLLALFAFQFAVSDHGTFPGILFAVGCLFVVMAYAYDVRLWEWYELRPWRRWSARQPEPASEAEHALRAAIEAGNKHALTDLGDLLSKRTGAGAVAERAYREALEAGDRRAWIGLGNLLYKRGRQREAEEAYRAALDAGYPGGWLGVGNLLAHQRGREREAEQVYHDALQSGWVETGDVGSLWRNLGLVLQADKSRRAESEAAYRRAIEAGKTEALLELSMLLLKQKGREREAETVYLEAVQAGYRLSGVVRLAAAVKHKLRRAPRLAS
jgi:Tfp pilus assembly protein PilF